MQIQFLGASQTVTGSKYLITTAKQRVLIDCGLFQGLKELRLRNWEKFPVDPKTIDAVILTHAHLDHCGYLPILCKNGFTGKIYCTAPTKDLCEIVLPDAGHIQQEEAARANKYGYSKHKPALPLYNRAEAEAMLAQLTVMPYYQEFTLEDLTVTFRHAGHILGADSVLLRNANTTILFSGDIGRSNDPCVFPPDQLIPVDYLVIESTYGNRLHETINPKDQLAEIINTIAKRGSTLIIPSFAIGRTQSILYYIYQLMQENRIPTLPIFLDSPMARNATDIMLKYADEHRLNPKEAAAACGIGHYVNSVEESKRIDANTFPKIIISASGMAVGGRVLHHIKAFAHDARNIILFVGFQAAGTRGEALIHGRNQVKIYGEIVQVACEIKVLNNISAHADYQEILTWLQTMRSAPKKIFITHGEPDAAFALQEKITKNLHWQCFVPTYLYTEVL